MNRQEQLKKFCEDVPASLRIDYKYCGNVSPREVLAETLMEKGYIKGTDFIEYLKVADILEKEYPHLAVALCSDDVREELSSFVDTTLQQYLEEVRK